MSSQVRAHTSPTQLFEDNNLVATYVQIEAWSVEDKGSGICYNVLRYNVQPGIAINYATSDSAATGEVVTTAIVSQSPSTQSYSANNQININTTVYLPASGKCYHKINNCGRMNPSKTTSTTESNAIAQGYSKCTKCW